VRPWLVVIGLLFLTLAGGTVAALYFAAAENGNVVTYISPPYAATLAPNQTVALPFDGPAGNSETFTLSWHAVAPIHVVLEQSTPCASSCPTGPVLVVWASNATGTWTGHGPFHYPLLCLLTNPQTRATNATVLGRAVSTYPSPLPWVYELLLGAGAAGLFLVGGVSVFLGLFLRGNPYGPPSPVVSQHPDDVGDPSSDSPRRH
jgi:hypothetical protein